MVAAPTGRRSALMKGEAEAADHLDVLDTEVGSSVMG